MLTIFDSVLLVLKKLQFSILIFLDMENLIHWAVLNDINLLRLNQNSELRNECTIHLKCKMNRNNIN